MNWVESKALTPLKHDFLLAFFRQEARFFLTGGSALGIFYLEHRLSYDLDFFTVEGDIDWKTHESILARIVDEIGADIETVTAAPSFHRYQLCRGEETEILDFVLEHVPQVDDKKAVFGQIRVDTLREIAVNKICTLVGRCELKDLVDLYFLLRGDFDLEELLAAARTKEGGLEPAILSYVLSDFTIDELPDYLLAEVSVDELRAFVAELRQRFAELSYPD